MPNVYTGRSAILGGTRLPPEYRYWLEREWILPEGETQRRTIGFLGYNPSTADALKDDQTIRKEVEFSRRWGYSRLVKANLNAYRARDWHQLRGVSDPCGPENHWWLTKLFEQAEIVVCAWGGMPVEGYAKTLATWALGRPTARVMGWTKQHAPLHPLMLPYTTTLKEIHQ